MQNLNNTSCGIFSTDNHQSDKMQIEAENFSDGSASSRGTLFTYCRHCDYTSEDNYESYKQLIKLENENKENHELNGCTEGPSFSYDE